jgi:apolipoprotein N-acyltransferase
MNSQNQTAHYTSLKHNWLLRGHVLLLVGLLLMIISDMRGSSGIFAWFVPIPFLLHVTLYRGVKSRLWLLISLVVGAVLTLAKSISDPLIFSVSFSIMIGVVTGLRFYIAFLTWDYIRRWAGDGISIIAFPAIIVSLEYLQAFYSPFGVWGSLANTQVFNLSLLQTASLFGFLGISALMSWAAVLAASIILKGNLANRKIPIALFVIIFIALNVWGDLRLNAVPQGKHVLAAAITNSQTFTGALPDPEDPGVLSNTQALIERTRKAAKQGAAIAVWGEGSTIVTEKGEEPLLRTLTELAKRYHIAIVAAYVVVLPKDQQDKWHRMRNKFTWIQDNGDIAETYLKHHPVPGEGSVPGRAPLKIVSTKYGKMAGAICYDYDFPEMSLTHARLGADLVVVPGLDWRNMLKRHTLMARMRAIEGGFSLLRSANDATSMGFDNLGQIRAAMTSFGDNDHILLASLPVERTDTLYSRIGNVIAYSAILVFLILLFIAIRNHLRTKRQR